MRNVSQFNAILTGSKLKVTMASQISPREQKKLWEEAMSEGEAHPPLIGKGQDKFTVF